MVPVYTYVRESNVYSRRSPSPIVASERAGTFSPRRERRCTCTLDEGAKGDTGDSDANEVAILCDGEQIFDQRSGNKRGTYSVGVGVLAAGNVLRTLLVDELVDLAANNIKDGDCHRVSFDRPVHKI